MSSRINLLAKHKSFIRFESYFKILRLITYLGIIIFIFFTIFFYLVNANQKNKLDSYLKEKQSILNYFVEKKANEAEFIYFVKKQKQLNELLKDDARIILLPYYKLLIDTLKTASGASLISADINKQKNVQFTVGFANYSSLINFFDTTESEEFLRLFAELKMDNFSALENDKNKYQLNLTGVLKEINENQN